jgi:hypothetical protein
MRHAQWVSELYGESKGGPALKEVVEEMNKRFRRCEKTKVWIVVTFIDQRELTGEVDEADIYGDENIVLA